jgi:hypothetical protein
MTHRRRCLSTAFKLLLLVAALPAPAMGYDLLLRWTVPPESDVAGYHLHRGLASRAYTVRVMVGRGIGPASEDVVYYLMEDLQPGLDYYLAVTAFSTDGLESSYSNEKHVRIDTVVAPVADAGPDRTGDVGDVLVLGGLALDGVKHLWQQTAGPAATLSSYTTSPIDFRADIAGVFSLRVIAYDVQGVAAADSVKVTIEDGGTPAPTPTATPVVVVTATPTSGPPTTPGARSAEGSRVATIRRQSVRNGGMAHGKVGLRSLR